MFKKSFKQKSQINLRSSDKKKFILNIKNLFPTLTNEDIDIINGFKESLTKIKITTIKEESIEVYAFDKIPFFFDIVDSGITLPTVFMCWKFPHILAHVTTESFVLNKLQNGADLFCPGIITNGLLSQTSDFKVNQPVFINVSKNKAAMAVGIALANKEDILSCNPEFQSGKVVKVYHVIDDFLYKLHPEPKIPDFGLPDWAQPNNNINSENAGDSTNNDNVTGMNSDLASTEADDQLQENDVKEEMEKSSEESEKDKMNELLEYCFLKAAKTVPKTSYPILPATFYANHMLPSIPSGQELNIKKTKWKKFSVFLQEKSLQGLIRLEQIQRGEFTIAGVQHDHKVIREFTDPYDNKPILVEPVSKNSDKPSVLQVFSVSAATVPFFAKFGLRKNDEMTKTDVKVHLNDYVKRENLIHPENMEKVKLDPVLHSILKEEEVITRAELLSKMLEKMSIRYKVSSTPNVVHKGKMPYVDFEVCTRTGNKKVTLISNLESYGVNITNFSKELQQKAAASTTIVNPTVHDKKGPQVQVQGNQILIAVGILKEKYNINEKFMRGLDKAVKAKKKGK